MHINRMTLHEWMIREGLTDAAVAEKLGGKVGRSQVNRIRRGVSRPGPELARALESLTQIPAAKFVMGEAA